MCKEEQNEPKELGVWKSQTADFMLEMGQKYGDIRFLMKASDMVGMREVIRRKLSKGLPLWEADKEWLKNNLK